MPFETTMLAAMPAASNFASQVTQTTSELQQVPHEMQALLKTIAATRSDIVQAREERVALVKACGGAAHLAEWDRAVSETEAALTDLERLVEPVRLDILLNRGKIRAKTRLMWVMRDSKSLSATSDRLSLAHRRMLFARLMAQMRLDQERRSGRPTTREESPPPPPYGVHQAAFKKAVEERRNEDKERMAVSRSLAAAQGADSGWPPHSGMGATTECVTRRRDEEEYECSPDRYEQVRRSAPEARALTLEASPCPRRPTADLPTQRSIQCLSLPHLNELAALSMHGTPLPPPADPSAQSPSRTALAGQTRPHRSAPNISELDAMQVAAPTAPRPAAPSGRPRPSSASQDIHPRNSDPQASSHTIASLPDQDHDQFPKRESNSRQELRFSAVSAMSQALLPNPPDPTSPTERVASAARAFPLSTSAGATAPQRAERSGAVPKLYGALRDYTPYGAAAAATTASTSSSTAPNGVNVTHHSFAGHRQPVQIRWQPNADDVPQRL